MTKLRWPKTLDYLMKSITIVKKKSILNGPPSINEGEKERERVGRGDALKAYELLFRTFIPFPLSSSFLCVLCCLAIVRIGQ